MSQLAINKNSWHYQCREQLYRLWGFNSYKVPSLCVYSQTLFWITILTIIAAPFIILGWLILKLERIIYKFLSYTKVGEKILCFLDDKIKVGDYIDKESLSFEEGPATAAVRIALITLTILCLVTLVSFCIGGGFYLLITHIAQIPLILWNMICYLGWLIVWGCYGIGFAITAIGIFFKYLGIVVFNFLVSYLLKIIGWVVMIALASFVLAAIFYGIMRFMNTKIGQKLKEFFIFKYNGYQAAREKQKQIRREKIMNSEPVIKTPSLFGRFRKWLKEKIFTGKPREYKGKKVNQLNAISFVIQLIVSSYHGICPMVVFVEDEPKSKVVKETDTSKPQAEQK